MGRITAVDADSISDITIVNIGAPAHGVRAMYSRNTKVISDGIRNASSSTWATGSERTVRVRLNKPADAGLMGLTFRDGAYEQGKLLFKLRPKANPMGSIWKIDLLEPGADIEYFDEPWDTLFDSLE